MHVQLTGERPSASVRRVLAFVGASLYWPLLRRNGLFFSLSGHDGTNAESVAWLALFLLLCVCIVGVCCAMQARVRGSLTRCGGIVLGLVGAQAICKSVEVFVAPAGQMATALAFVDTALYAFTFVALTYMWAFWYLDMDARMTVVLSCATFGLSFVASDLARMLPDPINVIVFSLFPFLSAGAWVATQGAMGAGQAGGEPLAKPSSLSSSFSWPLVLVLALFLIAGGLIRGAMTGVVDGEMAPILPAMDALTVLFAALLAIFAARFRPSGRTLMNAWSVSVMVFFAGLLFTVAFAGDAVEQGRQIVIVGRTCLDLLYWIVLIGLVRETGGSAVRVMGVWFVLVDLLSSLLGYVFAPMAMALVGVRYEQVAVPLASATAFILIVASILFLNSSMRPAGTGAAAPATSAPIPSGSTASASTANASTPSGFIPSVPGGAGGDPAPSTVPANLEEALADRIDRTLAPYGLTERELEVAELLAEGNSQRKIAEVLFLSIGTVQSHIKSIYRKLDVHSRQELIDLLHA